MGMFAKLFSRITESSLMSEDIPVRYCFVMLLAIADPQGYVVGTDVAISRRLNMDLDEFRRCIEKLMSPDPDSNSMEEEGRRVIVSDCERGYFLVNYRKYRDTRDEEHRREYMRAYMRKYRGGNDVTPVNNGKQRKPALAQAEVESEEEKKARKARLFFDIPDSLKTDQFKTVWDEFIDYRKKKKAPLSQTAAKNILNRLALRPDKAVELLSYVMERNWQTFEEKWLEGTKYVLAAASKLPTADEYYKAHQEKMAKLEEELNASQLGS